METAPAPVAVSVVTTVYRSAPYLERYIAESLDALRRIGCESFELLFVDDGSPDDSLRLLLKKKESVPQIVVAELSRNFGQHHAIMAGLSLARGERVFLADSDVEVSPSVLVEFDREMRAGDWDVVYGYQRVRKGGFLERAGGGVFWRLFNAVSDVPVEPNMVMERLMNRRYVDELLRLGDRNLFIGGMLHWVGFRQKGVPVEKGQREGPSTYSFARRFRLMVEAITSFSAVPLRWILLLGAAVSALSLGFVLVLVALKLLWPDWFKVGWASQVALIAFGIGVTNMSVGMVGLYVSKVFTQVQGRPLYVLRTLHR